MVLSTKNQIIRDYEMRWLEKLNATEFKAESCRPHRCMIMFQCKRNRAVFDLFGLVGVELPIY